MWFYPLTQKQSQRNGPRQMPLCGRSTGASARGATIIGTRRRGHYFLESVPRMRGTKVARRKSCRRTHLRLIDAANEHFAAAPIHSRRAGLEDGGYGLAHFRGLCHREVTAYFEAATRRRRLRRWRRSVATAFFPATETWQTRSYSNRPPDTTSRSTTGRHYKSLIRWAEGFFRACDSHEDLVTKPEGFQDATRFPRCDEVRPEGEQPVRSGCGGARRVVSTNQSLG